MSNSNLPPFSRIEFEAGTVFSVGKKSTKRFYYSTNKIQNCIYDNHDRSYYALVTNITFAGFSCARSFFGKKIEAEILFRDCNQLPTAEASAVEAE